MFYITVFVAMMQSEITKHIIGRSRIITPGCDIPARARPVGVEILAARAIDALIGMRAEVIALRLQQIGRQFRRAVAIVESQRPAHDRQRDAVTECRSSLRRAKPIARR